MVKATYAGEGCNFFDGVVGIDVFKQLAHMFISDFKCNFKEIPFTKNMKHTNRNNFPFGFIHQKQDVTCDFIQFLIAIITMQGVLRHLGGFKFSCFFDSSVLIYDIISGWSGKKAH